MLVAPFFSTSLPWLRSVLTLIVLLQALPGFAAALINEIHVAPDVETEPVEFVEIYNDGASELDLSGWQLTDAIQFVFPSGTRLLANGFVVVAQDPNALQQKFGVVNAQGPWVGRLSNEGDHIVLRNATGNLVDEVEYRIGFPWPTVGDSPGDSMELLHPGLDNNLGGSWRASRLGESTSQDQPLLLDGSSWRYFKGTTEPSTPSTAWRQTTFDDSSWLAGAAPIGYGESFVATELADMPSSYSSVYFRSHFLVENPAALSSLLFEAQYDDGIKVWINGVNVLNANISSGEVPFDGTANSAIENADFVPFPINSPANLLVSGTNVIAVQGHNSSRSSSSDFFFDARLTARIGASSRGPSPGRQNIVFTNSAPPQIRQVTHQPQEPVSDEPVTLSARVTDPDGVAAVSLQFQIVEPGQYIELSDPAYAVEWTTVPMFDLGRDGDQVAGDGTYSATLPGSIQAHRRLIRYRITARDNQGATVLAPYPDDPEPNFAYFIYDGVPSWTGAIQPGSPDAARSTPVTYGANVLGRLPVYHLISKKNSVERSTWLDRYGGDLYKWKGTLVYDGVVYDHIGFRARGGVWRYAMGKNMWKFDFNRGHDFQPRDNYGRRYGVSWTKLNLGACIQQGDYLHRGEQGMFESVGFRLFNLAGVEAPHTHFVHFRIIDEAQEANPTDQYSGDFWGLYLAIEQEDGRFLDEHELPDGNFYKMEGGTGELNNQGPTAATDKSDLNNFMAAYRNALQPESFWRENFNLESYYSYQAIVQGIHHYDICYGKNYFYYLNPETQLWSVHPWDLDLTWADNMYDAGCGGTDEFKDRVLPLPGFQIEFRNRVRELRDLLFNPDQAWQLIDEYAAIIDDPNGGPGFVDADRAMWDYHPVMANSSLVNLSKAGQGRFYQAGVTKDFPGMVQKMKEYVAERGALLDQLANDSQIPRTPLILYVGPPGFPLNRLTFRTTPFSGSNPFAALSWRVGEVARGEGAVGPNAYEIDAAWESGELSEFAPDITLPSDALSVGHTYRVRSRMRDSTGRWGHWSSPVEFTVAAPDNAGALLAQLRVTELMPNPPAGNQFEFVELHNTSALGAMDLGGVTFSEGIEYTFPAGTIMEGGGYILVVQAPSANNFATFRAHYNLPPTVPIYGPYSGSLNNDGEQITLKTALAGEDIVEFEYGDGPGWPPAADGAGHSLVALDRSISTQFTGSLSYPLNWRASTFIKGSPGKPDPSPLPGAVLNEVVANPSPDSQEGDWIELANPTRSSLAFGPNWFLSDDAADLKKWALPIGAVLPAAGWLVVDQETGFGNPAPAGFGLSRNGDELYLSHLPGTSADRVVDSVRFEAQEDNWSWARYPDGSGHWIGLAPISPGAANTQPSVGVRISEIMFHPEPTDVNPEDNTNDEYIEITNFGGSPVPLSHGDGVWRVAGGVNWVFPPNTVLAPGAAVLLVSFNPANPAALATFRQTYRNLETDTLIQGPFEGRLSNNSDRISLEKPQSSGITNEPIAWVVLDEVNYFDRTPWPALVDGGGQALDRIATRAPGNDPASWRAASPSPGQRTVVSDDVDGDGLPDAWELAHDLDPAFSGDAALDPDLDGLTSLQEYQAGTHPNDSASGLRLTATVADGSVLLRFEAAANRAYILSYRNSVLETGWQMLGHVPALSSKRVVEIQEPLTDNERQRFYRVLVVPP